MAVYPDPQGDVIGVGSLLPDLESVSGVVANDNLVLTLDFFNSIAAPLAVGATIDLDTDQNVATGRPSVQSTAALPGQPGGAMGADIGVFVAPNSSVADLFDTVDPDRPVRIGQVPISYGTDQIVVTIPLLLLNNYLGNTQAINFSTLVQSAPPAPGGSDAAPNTEVAVVTGIPAPLLRTGTAGNDQLVGTDGRDSISGLAGSDTIQALAAADVLNGDEGNDRLEAGGGNDIAQGGDGDDRIFGAEGVDQLLGGAGVDQINGDQGSDRIFGEAGNDKLNGGQDSDTVFGGGGNDEILEIVQRGRRALFEEDTLNGEGGNDTIDGGADRDTISGGSGRDRLAGGDASDTINGDAGNDVLIGVNPRSREDAIDTLTGGSGRDRFVLGDTRRIYYLDVVKEQRFFDNALITDFQVGQDTIQLRGSADLYRLNFVRRGGQRQAQLIYEGTELLGGPEEIAILRNVSRLSLTSASFDYV